MVESFLLINIQSHKFYLLLRNTVYIKADKTALYANEQPCAQMG